MKLKEFIQIIPNPRGIFIYRRNLNSELEDILYADQKKFTENVLNDDVLLYL